MALPENRAPLPPVSQQAPSWRQRFHALVASRRFQRWAARFPLTRGITRREGDAMMDLVAGFVHSQCLSALVSLDILPRLMEREQTAEALARAVSVPTERLDILLRAGVSLGLLTEARGLYAPTRRGAALTGVPGLADMIRHHSVLYRDLSDPVAFFKGEVETELAQFWPYVFGAGAATDPDAAARYSALMADSQTLVAEDTLDAVSFSASKQLMDVGGGTGAFLCAALARHPHLSGVLFDLPAVVGPAQDRIRTAGQSERVCVQPGSFRDDALPQGADTISLVRVLYDHSDETVAALLSHVFQALPPGGQIVISEPMGNSRAGDAYFAIYTLAMQTGRTRDQSDIARLLIDAGFVQVRTPTPRRAFVTSVVVAKKPDT